MLRPRGWIQDSGSLENLIKVVELFDARTTVHNNLLVTEIPIKILLQNKRNQIEQSLTTRDGYLENPLISFNSLVGTRTPNHIVDSIIQCLIPGQNRLGIVDWACDNFVRFAYTLNFISYVESSDSFTITDLGLKLTNATTILEKFEIIKLALKKYPPVSRVLQLLCNQYNNFPLTPSLTKFEIGSELGFKGEDGFTTYSQNVFVQALNSTQDTREKSKIRQNWEGSSDKYARMISGWLMHSNIGWVQSGKKRITVRIGNDIFNETLQAYQITIAGINAFRSCRAFSRNAGIPKSVSFEMLATKGVDKEFLRMRRAYILKSIIVPKSTKQIIRYLDNNNLTGITEQTVIDDLKNLERIGLEIINKNSKYKLTDSIESLEIPQNLIQIRISPSTLEQTKQLLRQELQYIGHEFLDLLDFSIAGQASARQFEVRIVELLNKVIVAKHLSGGNRPEIIGYNPQENPAECIIMDSKSYATGFPIPAHEADKMIRYVEEYKAKNYQLNSNRWWENYKSPDYPTSDIKYSFVSSSFIGNLLQQLIYINNRTHVNGSAISALTLLRKVDSVLGNKNGYDLNQFFNELGSNTLVN